MLLEIILTSFFVIAIGYSYVFIKNMTDIEESKG